MQRSKRLSPVVRIKNHEEKDAALRLSRFRQEHERNEEKLAELRAFYDDYAARMNSAGVAGTSMRTINQYRRFLARLHDAVRMQQELVSESARQLQELGREWRERHVERRVLDKVVDRLERGEERRERKREQAASDDRAQHGRSGSGDES